MDKSILISAWNDCSEAVQTNLKKQTPFMFACYFHVANEEISKYSLDQILPVCSEFIQNNYT